MKWHYCENCSQVQRFGRTCSSCGDETEEVDLPRDQFQLALPMAGAPLAFIGLVGFLARDFVYEVVGESGVCCTMVAVVYCLLVVTVLGMSVIGHLRGRQRAADLAEEEDLDRWEESAKDSYHDEPVYETRDYKRQRRDDLVYEQRPPRRRSRRGRDRRRSRKKPPKYEDGYDDFDQLDDWL